MLQVRDLRTTLCVMVAAFSPVHAIQAQVCTPNAVEGLPVVERPDSTDRSAALVVLLTGDGGWAKADELVARGLIAKGGAVVGLNMRSYLKAKRTPEDVAHDVGCLAREYMARWQRNHFMLLGYSRGADLAPFVANRLPADLSAALTMVALVSPARTANFQFHLIDLVRDVKRDDDVPMMPEMDKLRGRRTVCIYGRDDSNTLCTTLDTTFVTVVDRDGGHRIRGGFDALSESLIPGLRAIHP